MVIILAPAQAQPRASEGAAAFSGRAVTYSTKTTSIRTTGNPRAGRRPPGEGSWNPSRRYLKSKPDISETPEICLKLGKVDVFPYSLPDIVVLHGYMQIEDAAGQW